MHRREFFMGLSSAGAAATGVSACAARDSSDSSLASDGAEIRAICFDPFTLFDPSAVVAATQAVVGDQAPALWDVWRTRLFEYTWLRASGGNYVDFRQVTRDALAFATRARGLTLTEEAAVSLIDAFSRLEPWPDTREHLATWRAAGLRLALLSNFTPTMLGALIDHAGLSSSFDALISTDAACTFKPDPRAYALGPATLGVNQRQIAYSAYGGWDAAGAKWFGFPTFWVNRGNVPGEELAPGYDATGTTLAELAAFVAV